MVSPTSPTSPTFWKVSRGKCGMGRTLLFPIGMFVSPVGDTEVGDTRHQAVETVGESPVTNGDEGW